jgi:nucleotide-binding universal stress UspA family protein
MSERAPNRTGKRGSTAPLAPDGRAAQGSSGRVLLLLGGVSPRVRGAIDTAVRLADTLERRLDCVFVEDIELFYAAALPFTRELGTYSTGPRTFDIADMERATRREAHQAERAVAELAQRAGVRWTFQAARGRLLDEARRRAQAGDFVVIGAPGLAAARDYQPELSAGAPQGVLALVRSLATGIDTLLAAARAAPEALLSIGLLVRLTEESKAMLEQARAELARHCQDVEHTLGRPLRWAMLEPALPPQSIEAMLERVRPQLVALSREALEAELAALTHALRRLGGTVVVPS